jgi:hypothetical protein
MNPTRGEKQFFWGAMTAMLLWVLLAAGVAFGIYELVRWLID